MPGNDSDNEKNHPPTQSITISDPPYTYMHLSLTSSSGPTLQDLDLITARTHLTSALQSHLGLTGTAIPIDLLKVSGSEVWIRVAREDASAVQAALSQWASNNGDASGNAPAVAWRVRGTGESLAGVVAGDGRDLFRP